MEFLDNLRLHTRAILFGFEFTQSAYFWLLVVSEVLVFSIGYNILSYFVQNCLVSKAVPLLNRMRIGKSIWRLIFCLWVIVLFSIDNWKKKKYHGFVPTLPKTFIEFNCKSSLSIENYILSELSFFATPIAFFSHQLIISVTDHISKPAILSMGSLTLFILSTKAAKCLNLCYQVLFYLSLNVGSAEIARVLYGCNSRCKGYKGPSTPRLHQILPLLSFIVHIAVWIAINFYEFPSFYFSLPSLTNSEANLPSRSSTAFINLFLLFFAKEQIFDSPVWSLLKLVVKPSAKSKKLSSLPATVLLNYSSPLLQELEAIQLNNLRDTLPTRMVRRKLLSPSRVSSEVINKRGQEKADFIRVIQCVNLMKRKIGRYKERKSFKEEEGEISNEREDLEDNFSSSSSSAEITDIFIPVPSVNPSPCKTEEKECHNGNSSISEAANDSRPAEEVNSRSSDAEAEVNENPDDGTSEEMGEFQNFSDEEGDT